MRLEIFGYVCWHLYFLLVNFLFTSFACIFNVLINSTNTYGVLLWTEYLCSPKVYVDTNVQYDGISSEAFGK